MCGFGDCQRLLSADIIRYKTCKLWLLVYRAHSPVWYSPRGTSTCFFIYFFYFYSTAKWCPTTVIRTYGTVRPWLYGETSARDTVVLVRAEKQFGLGFGLYCGFPRQQVDSLGHFDGKDRPIGLKISNRRLQTGITGCCGISRTLHRGLIIL